MAPHSSTVAWRIPWREEPGGLQSMWLERVRHDWVTNTFNTFTLPTWKAPWLFVYCCWVNNLCLTLCDPMDCSAPDFCFSLSEFTQTHAYWVGDAIQPPHPPLTPNSSCLQSSPAIGSFPASQFFVSHGQSIGASASTSVLPTNIQGWFPLGFTGASSGSWRWTGKPGVLQSMGSQRIRHNWETELNWLVWSPCSPRDCLHFLPRKRKHHPSPFLLPSTKTGRPSSWEQRWTWQPATSTSRVR